MIRYWQKAHKQKAVLTAIAIPVFTAQLEKSRDSTDQANIRSAYAELVAALITNDKAADVGTELAKSKTFEWTAPTNATGNAGDYVATISGKGTNTAWDNLPTSETFTIGTVTVTPVANFKTATFTVDTNGQVSAIVLAA